MKKDVFKAPHDESIYYLELESAAKKHLDRHALDCFFSDVKKRIEAFFDHEDDWLRRQNVIYLKLTNFEVASMQIRHLMYHVGRLNKVLQDELGQATPWIDYFGT